MLKLVHLLNFFFLDRLYLPYFSFFLLFLPVVFEELVFVGS